MKITVTKVIRELEEKHGWSFETDAEEFEFQSLLIKDTLKIVDEILRTHKNITILK